MKTITGFLRSTLLTFILISALKAGGYQLNEHGVRAVGMGGAFTAIASDPSAVFFNPAGLTQLHGFQVMGGSVLIFPSSSFRGVTPAIDETKADAQVHTPINAYASYAITDDIVAAVGVYNPYGLGLRWPDSWIGRTLVTEVDMKTFYYSPTIAYRITPELSVGAGIDLIAATVKLARKGSLDPLEGEAKVTIKGDGSATAFRAGILYEFSKDFSAGVAYRSGVMIDISGEATPEGNPKVLSLLPKGDVKTSFPAPMNISTGIAYRLMTELLVSADFQYIEWSAFKELNADFKDPAYPDLYTTRDYKNSYIARLGGEYRLDDDITVRGGLFYDRNSIPVEYLDPLLPDADRIGLNIGASYRFTTALSADISYMFLRFAERSTEGMSKVYYSGDTGFNGVYNSIAQLAGFSISYHF